METNIPGDIKLYVKNVYEFIKATSPNGYAEEVFRLPPDYTKTQELLFNFIESH